MAIIQEQIELKPSPVQGEKRGRFSPKGILDTVQSVSAVGRLVESSALIRNVMGPVRGLTILAANPALEVGTLVAVVTFSLVRSVNSRANKQGRVDDTPAETPGRRRVKDEYHPSFIRAVRWVAPKGRPGSNKSGNINSPSRPGNAVLDDLECI